MGIMVTLTQYFIVKLESWLIYSKNNTECRDWVNNYRPIEPPNPWIAEPPNPRTPEPPNPRTPELPNHQAPKLWTPEPPNPRTPEPLTLETPNHRTTEPPNHRTTSLSAKAVLALDDQPLVHEWVVDTGARGSSSSASTKATKPPNHRTTELLNF